MQSDERLYSNSNYIENMALNLQLYKRSLDGLRDNSNERNIIILILKNCLISNTLLDENKTKEIELAV